MFNDGPISQNIKCVQFSAGSSSLFIDENDIERGWWLLVSVNFWKNLHRTKESIEKVTVAKSIWNLLTLKKQIQGHVSSSIIIIIMLQLI